MTQNFPKLDPKWPKSIWVTKKWLELFHFVCSKPFWFPKGSRATFFQWRGQNGKKFIFFMDGRAQTFPISKLTLILYYGVFSGNLKRVFLRKMHFCVHPFQPKNDHFWSPEGPFLAKNLENKVFSVHTIQNFPICNPNVAPKKVTIFGPRDPPWPPHTPLDPPQGSGGAKNGQNAFPQVQ